MNRPALLLSLLLPLFCGGALAADAHQLSQEIAVHHAQQRYVYPDPEIPTAADAPGRTTRPSADALFEQRLWRLLAAGRLEALQQTITAHQAKVPGWRPPRWLTVELARARLRGRVDAVRAQPAQLLALFKEHPELFSCREYYNLWSLADAYQQLEDGPNAIEVHGQMLATCPQPKVLLATLDRVAANEGVAAALERLAGLKRRQVKGLSHDELLERDYHWRLQLGATLRGQGRNEDAAQQLGRLGEQIARRRDLDAARLLAWSEHDAGHGAEANRWFEQIAGWSGQESDRLILLQRYADGGERATALAWLQHNALESAPARQWAADLLRGEAAKRFERQEYPATLRLLEDERRFAAAPSYDSAMLAGWSNFKLERYAEAQQAFAEGYRVAVAERRADAAEGVLLAALHSGDWPPVRALAQTAGGPLLTADGESELVGGLESGAVSAGRVEVAVGHLRQRAGDDRSAVVAAGPGWLQRRGAGLGDYTLWRSPLVQWQWGGDDLHVYGRVDRYRFTSSTPAGGERLGSGRWQVDSVQQAADFSAEGDGELLLGLRQAAGPLFVELGRSADGGAVKPTWLGRLGYARHGETGGFVAALYRKPRYDSLLSYVGMVDPYSGTRWGRVVEQGAALDGYRPVGGGWQLGAHLGLFSLNGDGVAQNSGGDLYLALQRTVLSDERGGSLQIGPYLYATSYRDNLSHYSLGQGGYYSPQLMAQAGLSGEWLHRSGSAVVRITGSAGYQGQHEDVSPLYPLTASTPFYTAADSGGLSGRLALSWVATLGASRWQWAGLVSAAEGPAFGLREGWLFLRYRFDGRSSVDLEDLPERWSAGLPGHI